MCPDPIHHSRNLIIYLENRGLGLPRLPVILPLLGVVGSEIAVFYGNSVVALWGYLITLLLCVLEPLFFDDDANMLQVLALIPVFRLVNLGMPIFFDSPLYWLLFVYSPLLPACYLLAKAQPNVTLSLGWKRAILAIPLAIPISAGLGILEYSVLEPEPLIQRWNVSQLFLVGVVMFGFVSVVEEVLFRGIIQRVFENELGRPSGLIIASTLFGLMHSGYGLPIELLYGAFIGLLLGVVYDYIESLLLVILMHGTLNIILFAVAPHQPWLVSYLTSMLT